MSDLAEKEGDTLPEEGGDTQPAAPAEDEGYTNPVNGLPRKVTWWADIVGAIATILGFSAGIVNLGFYFREGMNPYWLATWLTELIWSGVIELSAITAVFITDSDLLRAIGGFSMVFSNLVPMVLMNV